jgi:hypothetical protein
MIHAANTCPKRTQDSRYRACPATEIQRLLGDDWQFYQVATGGLENSFAA